MDLTKIEIFQTKQIISNAWFYQEIISISIPLLDKITWQRILDNYHRVLNCLQNDLTNNYDQVLNFFSFYFLKSRGGSSKSDYDLDPGNLEGWKTLMTNVKDLIQVSLEDRRAEFSKSMAHPDDISCSDLNDDLKNLNQIWRSTTPKSWRLNWHRVRFIGSLQQITASAEQHQQRALHNVRQLFKIIWLFMLLKIQIVRQ